MASYGKMFILNESVDPKKWKSNSRFYIHFIEQNTKLPVP